MRDGWRWVVVDGNDAGDYIEDHYIKDGRSLCGRFPNDEYPIDRRLTDEELEDGYHYCLECTRLEGSRR